jgi:2-polyprenyl-6-hydroxyphenyl methylase/3-demethylubiquinone-9 3-methyltransferase
VHNPTSFHDQGWKATANRQSLYQDPTTSDRKRLLRRYLDQLAPDSKVLDYGCGRGEFTEYLAALGFRAVGVDLSLHAIDFNQRDFPELEFTMVDDDARAPFEDEFFDAIWSSEVIEHVYDVHAVFAEFSRLLRCGGRLIITTPYHGWLKNMLIVTFGFERHFDVEWQHIRFWTKRSLAKVAGTHGLKPVAWHSVGRIPWLAKSFFVVFERAAS